MENRRNLPIGYFLYIICILTAWTTSLLYNDWYYLLSKNIAVIITMIAGSFIAGSSPEGSASVAFPVFTLYLGILPETARNFGFAIQSIGMTAASIFILNRKITVDFNYIKYVIAGGLLGLLAGTFYVVPYVSGIIAKLLFVSLWLGFGMILFYENKIKNRQVVDRIFIRSLRDLMILFFLGMGGGILSSIFGAGINILSFCFVVMYYNLNEKVATPSSIVIMAVESIAGFALHSLWLKDMTVDTYELWFSCIPFVIFFAPLGAYVIDKISRNFYNNFLYTIFIVQYLGALIVIKPKLPYLLFSLFVIIFSILFFKKIRKLALHKL